MYYASTIDIKAPVSKVGSPTPSNYFLIHSHCVIYRADDIVATNKAILARKQCDNIINTQILTSKERCYPSKKIKTNASNDTKDICVNLHDKVRDLISDEITKSDDLTQSTPSDNAHITLADNTNDASEAPPASECKNVPPPLEPFPSLTTDNPRGNQPITNNLNVDFAPPPTKKRRLNSIGDIDVDDTHQNLLGDQYTIEGDVDTIINRSVFESTAASTHDHSSLDEPSLPPVIYKCARVGFDGSWHNRIYGRNSLNGCATFLDQNTKKIIHFDTRSKGYNYPKDGVSGNMEPEMLLCGVSALQSKRIHPFDISVDGDSKIPKLIRALNNDSA
eukprot:898005_1